MITKSQKNQRINRRQKTNKIIGTAKRPRLCVTKSHKHIYAQIIDDIKKHTLSSCSTLTPEIQAILITTRNCKAATTVGKKIAEQAIKIGIRDIVFDRRNKIYHGRIKALADAARNAGMHF